MQEETFYLIYLDRTLSINWWGVFLKDKPIFYDSDILICFLAIHRVDILKKLFSKVIVPAPVYHELINIEKYKYIRNKLHSLISDGFVEVSEFEFASPEESKYNLIRRGFWSDGNPIGKGESAAMAFAIENNGIVASNNLTDVLDICDDYEIPILTSSIILAFCFELNLMSKQEIESVWKEILDNTKQKLPKETFNEYFNELFENDCVELLKNYNFKRHYAISQKKAKI